MLLRRGSRRLAWPTVRLQRIEEGRPCLSPGENDSGECALPERTILYTSDSYDVSFYDRSPDDAVVVFISAGGHILASDERVEEFSKTLKGHDCSLAFVNDKKRSWYNHADTPKMFQALRVQLGGRRVAALGESMGGCGALLSTNHLDVSRVLAISPQFSVAPPFALFDEAIGYLPTSPILRHYIDDFGRVADRSRCHLMYGNCDWRDLLHRTMFEVRGFDVATLRGFGHGVSAALKAEGRLTRLISAFLNYNRLFNISDLASGVSDLVTASKLASPDQRLLPLREAEFSPPCEWSMSS